MYDYLIVGSGLYGAVFAHEALKRGRSVLAVEKRDHIGGNIYSENVGGINVHKYGPHIFHTNSDDVWNYVNQFATFNRFTLMPVAHYKDELYNMPFNMNTFSKMWNISTPAEAQEIIEKQRAEIPGEPKNLEEQAINVLFNSMSVVGPRSYISSEQACLPDDRLQVKPGLTCYWQITDTTQMSYEDQLELDYKYIRERGIRTDLKLIWKTVCYVVGAKNC